MRVHARRFVGIAAIVTLAVGALGWEGAAAAAPSTWPQLGSNAGHTSVNAKEKALRASNVGSLRQQWKTQVGTALDGPAGVPVVAHGDVYVAEGSTIVAENLAGGTSAWTFTAPGLTTDPVVAHKTVFTFAAGRLYALNARTGAVRRRTPMIDTEGLVYAHGVLYTEPAVSGDNLAAYHASSGHRIWRAAVDGPVNALPAVGHAEIIGVETTTAGWMAEAYATSDGRRLWSRKVRPEPGSEPVISRKSVIIATASIGPIKAGLTRLNATTGAVVWEKTLTTAGLLNSAPAVFHRRIFQTEEGSFCIGGRETSTITVRKVSTGAQVWSRVYENIPCSQFQLVATEQRSPVVANHLVYVSALNAKKIRVYTTAGALAAAVPTGEFTMSTPVVAASHVVVSTWDTSTDEGFVEAFARSHQGVANPPLDPQ
jgi:outer membrane protein assembly factor BamB